MLLTYFTHNILGKRTLQKWRKIQKNGFALTFDGRKNKLKIKMQVLQVGNAPAWLSIKSKNVYMLPKLGSLIRKL